MLRTPVGRLRMIGLVEGISFLILLGIAMPLKHFAEMPEAVRIVGWVHGILFIGFLVALMLARDAMRWSFRWTGLVLLAALLPFGPFVIDGRLRKEDEELPSESPKHLSSDEFRMTRNRRGRGT
jgi:integral membrane protein